MNCLNLIYEITANPNETKHPREKFTRIEPQASVRRQAREAKKAAHLKAAY